MTMCHLRNYHSMKSKRLTHLLAITIVTLLFKVFFTLSALADSVTESESESVSQSDERIYKSCGYNHTEQCVPYELCNEGIKIGNKYYVDHTRTVLDDDCHYMEKCCEIEQTLQPDAQTEQAITLPYENRHCGQHLDEWFYLRPLGYKQHETKFAEFPGIVAIFTSTLVYLCSGALITPLVVVTAAHCIEMHQSQSQSQSESESSGIVVRAGEWDMSVELEPFPHQNRRVKEFIIHENFTKTPVMHNLALLVLDAPYELTPHVQTICLPTPETNFNYTQCYVSGWDKAQFSNIKHSPSTKLNHSEIMLKKVPMFALPSDQCAAKMRLAILGRRYTLHDSFICTGGDKHDYVCQRGDGAGGFVPLVCVNECDAYVLAGLLARGARCDSSQLLGIYTNIKYYRPWIDLKLRERDVDIRYYMN